MSNMVEEHAVCLDSSPSVKEDQSKVLGLFLHESSSWNQSQKSAEDWSKLHHFINIIVW